MEDKCFKHDFITQVWNIVDFIKIVKIFSF